jgi:cytochrome c-type biogenesis protein CcmH/NrfG
LAKLEGNREIFAYHKPQDMRLLLLISECYIKLGEYDQAAGTLKNILRKAPNNIAARQKLASFP